MRPALQTWEIPVEEHLEGVSIARLAAYDELERAQRRPGSVREARRPIVVVVIKIFNGGHRSLG
jgi:hypothetical protein